MVSANPKGFKKINPNLAGFIFIVLMVGFYASPLLFNMEKTLTLYPKNIPNVYLNYLPGFLFKDSILKFGIFPFWGSIWEGGRPLFENLADISLNPFSLFILILGEVKGFNISWYIFFIIGACSMFYLCRYILKYNISGSIFASLIFSMSGFFGYLFENGFLFSRELLLLPLLVAFFVKSKENRRYVFLTSLILSLMFIHVALFFPIIVLFLFLFAFLQSLTYRDRKVFFDAEYLRIFVMVCLLAVLFSAAKIIPLLRSLVYNNRISGFEYADSLSDPNTLSLFLRRTFIPEHYGPGTMYLGLIPVFFSILGAIIYFRQVKMFFFLLLFFIFLSFGPNSPIDLHRLLWHLPFFKSMSEISKYYAVMIVFLIAILAGKSFSLFNIKQKNILNRILPILIILFTYVDLLNANIGYFNTFNEPLQYQPFERRNFHIKGLNMHQGNESIIESLTYFLAKKYIGITNPHYVLNKESKVIPKYYILPRYVFMSPYTSLLVIPNPLYKGEAFFLESENKVKDIRFLPNHIFIDIDMKVPGRLIVNQNFDNDWKTDTIFVSEYSGLISLQINKSGRKTIHLRYFPKMFLFGLAISLTSLSLAGYMLIRKK